MAHGLFEDQWPPLAARLGKRMARSCPDPSEREDLVQEVGLRLFRMWERVDDRPLWPLVLTIALNLRRDACRSWHEAEMPLIHDVPAAFDVEREGLARVELSRVHEALQLLSAAHRAVLLAEIGKLPPADMSPAAVKMTRMRARRRLNELLEGSSGIFIFVTFEFKERFISWRNSAVHRAHALGQNVDLAPLAAGMMAAAMTLVVPATPGAVTSPDETEIAVDEGATKEEVSSQLQGARSRSLAGERPSTPRRVTAEAQDRDRPQPFDGEVYDVGLPAGNAEVAAEGSFAGSRLALGSVAPAICLGAPGSGACGTNGAPLVRVRASATYGDIAVNHEVSEQTLGTS